MQVQIERTQQGQFVKGGISPNPGGRPSAIKAVTDLARTYTAEAIATLADLMRDDEEPGGVRLAAASALLDRGWGRPAQSVAIGVLNDPERTALMQQVLGELQHTSFKRADFVPTIEVEASSDDRSDI